MDSGLNRRIRFDIMTEADRRHGCVLGHRFLHDALFPQCLYNQHVCREPVDGADVLMPEPSRGLVLKKMERTRCHRAQVAAHL